MNTHYVTEDLSTDILKILGRDRYREEIVPGRMEMDTAHDLSHLDRVWGNCLRIREGSEDIFALQAAAYLHDLVNYPKTHKDRSLASRHSAEKAGPILDDLFSENMDTFQRAETIMLAQDAIEAHSFSSGWKAETPEARVLQDADRLDALGHVGIARLFACGGALGIPLYRDEDPFTQRRDPEDCVYTLDHYEAKLRHLPGRMNTEKGRLEAHKRLGVMKVYLAGLRDEIQ